MSKQAPIQVVKKLSALYNIISHPYTFIFIFFVVIGWFVTGYGMHFNEEWYKAFHLFEMSIALLMVFVIETTQQADNRAMQEKLDEIIKKMPAADNKKAGIEKEYKGEK